MKNMKTVMLGVSLLMLIAFGPGCLDTKVPPYLSEDIMTDDKMIGQWMPVSPKTGEEPPVYTVIPSGDNLYQVQVKENGKESTAKMVLFKLDGTTYLTLSYSDSDEHDTVRYDWEGEALKIRGFDQKAFQELSEKEKLDIDFKMDPQTMVGPEVTFNTATDKLRNFIMKYGPQVFTEAPMEFKRINE